MFRNPKLLSIQTLWQPCSLLVFQSPLHSSSTASLNGRPTGFPCITGFQGWNSSSGITLRCTTLTLVGITTTSMTARYEEKFSFLSGYPHFSLELRQHHMLSLVSCLRTGYRSIALLELPSAITWHSRDSTNWCICPTHQLCDSSEKAVGSNCLTVTTESITWKQVPISTWYCRLQIGLLVRYTQKHQTKSKCEVFTRSWASNDVRLLFFYIISQYIKIDFNFQTMIQCEACLQIYSQKFWIEIYPREN